MQCLRQRFQREAGLVRHVVMPGRQRSAMAVENFTVLQMSSLWFEDVDVPSFP